MCLQFFLARFSYRGYNDKVVWTAKRRNPVKPVAKYFEELSAKELYEILRVRSAVFVVEQQCAYQDVDGMDEESLHVFYESDGQIAAYLRAFPKPGEKGTVQMGRVLSAKHGKGLGGRILREGLLQIQKKMDPARIYIEAQTYAVGFYEREGFRVCSGEFLEDGIPHVGMIKEMKPEHQKGEIDHEIQNGT